MENDAPIILIPTFDNMSESAATETIDDQDLVAITSALILEEKDVQPKSRAPFGSR